jgi:DNA-binding winged helix-turn-helix (wHTH) protein
MALRKLRFDDFRLDPARRELWRGDERLNLPPKVFECIAYLAEHRDRAVGRDELIAAVWGRAEVTDNLLDQIMLRARRTLGDTEGERRVIRTVPRFGYAWVAATESVDEDTEPAAAAIEATPEVVEPATPSSQPLPATEPDAPTRPRRRSATAWAAAAVLFASVLVAAYSLRRHESAPAPAKAPSNLALLLPVTIEADAKFAWARLGAMELIADRLRASGQPMLPSDNVVALARDLHGTLPDAAELDGIARTSATNLIMKANATLSAGYWRVSVESLRGREPPLHAEGESRDLMEAAQAAADGAARALGLTPPKDGDLLSPRERALAGLLQQVEAAMLADQPDTARALLDSLDDQQRALPEVRFRQAGVNFQSGRLDAAESEYRALLDSASTKDDPLFRARVLSGLGNIASRRDDYAAAERNADAVVALLSDLPPSSELGRALTGRAIARSAQFRFDLAVADFAQSRVVLESVGDRFGLTRIDANLGILEARRERYAEALPLLEGAAERLGTFHDLTSELFVRVAASYAHLALLDPAAALAGEPRLRELVAREPNPQYRRYATLARIDALDANGRLTDAQKLLQDVIDDAEKSGDAALLGSARVVAARMALDRGDATAAAKFAQAALAKAWEAEMPREQANAWLDLVRAQIALRDDGAAASAAALTAWAQHDRTPPALLIAALGGAEQAAAAGERDAARAAFESALTQAEASRIPEDLLDVCSAYAEWLIRSGDLQQAGAVAARVASWAPRSYEASVLQARLYRALGQETPWRNALAQARRLAGERPLPALLEDESTVKR